MTNETVAGILIRVMQPENGTLAPEVAQCLLSWRFPESDQQRVKQLSAKAHQGTLTREEELELDNYLHVADFLALVHSKARTALNPVAVTS